VTNIITNVDSGSTPLGKIHKN